MRRILFYLALMFCLCFSLKACADAEPVHLKQCGDNKDEAIELQAATLYYVEPIKDQSRWYSFVAQESGQYMFYSECITGSVVTKAYNQYGEKMFEKGLINGIQTLSAKEGETYHLFMDVYPPSSTFWFSFCSPSQHVSYGQSEIRKAATCVTDGYMAQTCEYCGGEGTPVLLPATGHQSGGLVTAQQATCLQPGLDVDTCVNCGIVLSTITTPATDHRPGMWQTERKATCTSDGYRVQLCTGCGKTMDSQVVQAFGHSVSEWIEERPRCVSEGKRYKECVECGVELEYIAIPALGHSYSGWIEIQPPTKDQEGVEIRTCLSCGEEQSRKVAVLTWIESIMGR